MAPLRIGIIHPDLGIGGAERLVVDAALGLQRAGHEVQIFTSHHDTSHCFEETCDGTLSVKHFKSPFPRAIFGRFHIVFANLRQLHLIFKLLSGAYFNDPKVCDVYMVDQLSTCIPLLRFGMGRRVVFYCHFPDKLLADGCAARTDGKKRGSLLKRIYRLPADWLEEFTTSRADVILANSKFTAGVFKTVFPSIHVTPRVVYPGINIDAYEEAITPTEEHLGSIFDIMDYPSIISLNRIEGKKNLGLAIEAFAKVRRIIATEDSNKREGPLRLIIAGGFDPRLVDNVQTLTKLLELCAALGLSTFVVSTSDLPPSLSHLREHQTQAQSHPSSNVTFLLNFTTTQRTALLQSKNTLALLYTPTNEHFGIGPVEGMACGVPVVACESGGPMESIIPFPSEFESNDVNKLDPRPTGFLAAPTSEAFSSVLLRILRLSPAQREVLSQTARTRAKQKFGMNAMCSGLEEVLQETVSMGKMRGFGFLEKRELSQNIFEGITSTITLALIICLLMLIYSGYF